MVVLEGFWLGRAMGQVNGIWMGGFDWTWRSQGRREFAKVQKRENDDREAGLQKHLGGDVGRVGLGDGNMALGENKQGKQG